MTDPVNIPVFTQSELDAIYQLRAGTHVLVPVEIDRLWDALSWIENHDPGLIEAAEKRFGFSLSKATLEAAQEAE